MSYEPITIRLVRNSNASHLSDDVVHLIPCDTSRRTYYLRFIDHLNQTRSETEVVESEYLDYVRNLITLAKVDADPYESIQISTPSFPVILLDIDDIDFNVQSALIDVLTSAMRSYPVSLTYSRRAATHTSSA